MVSQTQRLTFKTGNVAGMVVFNPTVQLLFDGCMNAINGVQQPLKVQEVAGRSY